MTMILVVTAETDVHADRVIGHLAERHVPVCRFDPAHFPTKSTLTARFERAGVQRIDLTLHGRTVALDRMAAVWFRRPQSPVADERLAPAARALVDAECATVVSDLLDTLDTLDVLAVPGPRPVVQRAHLKVRQLQLAGRLGFELPPTAVTNDPAELLSFWRTHAGAVISKQAGLTQLWDTGDGDLAGRYTSPVTHRDLLHAEGLRACPMILQASVPKAVELRATVVGDRVLTAEIHSQQSNRACHDWRRYDDLHTVYRPHQLPGDVERRCLALVRQLGLVYGAIDLILTPDGRYVFLEINPNGQYLWVEEASGLPISEAMADLFVAACRNRQPTEGALV